MHYTLEDDGDYTERAAYDALIKPLFPSYEEFWKVYVVPLTHRPGDAQLKTDSELSSIGKGHHELCIAQLHYTTLVQLFRAFRLTQHEKFGLDSLVFGLSALVGAQDCAFELLERFSNSSLYEPWLETRDGTLLGGREAQLKWRKDNLFPLQEIRNYRNRMMHGRTLPGIQTAGGFQPPKIGRETDYIDWRCVTAVNPLPMDDFDDALVIMNSAFEKTVSYFETQWKERLIPVIS